MTMVLLQVFLVLLLVAANAFFVAAEFALVSVRDTRIQQLVEARRTGARIVQRLHQRLDEVLAAVQLGVTLASLALGFVGEPYIGNMVQSALHGVVPPGYAHVIGLAIAFLLITYVVIILGEIVPKSLALRRAERVALAVAGPMDIFISIARPILVLVNRSSRVVLRGFGTRQMREGGVHSPEELKMMVTASSRVGLLPESQEDMLHRVLELENVTVREIMTPRNAIFSLPADMPLEEAMARVIEEQHSRVPIYDSERGPEHIVGLLYSKDVSRFMHHRLTSGPRGAETPLQLKVRNVMRDVMVVPETKPVSDLIEEFKRRKRHLAVVVDEFGSTAGVVSVEDALEQIVGELEDEFDIADQPTLMLAGGAIVLEGGDNIRDLETQLALALPRDEGFETLGGFVLARLGRIPTGGESFEYGSRRFTVLTMEGRRVAKVKVESLPAATRPA
jgi:putative hemolysin